MSGEKQENPWPTPKFYFKVMIDGVGEMLCLEVSGLDTAHDVIEYRASNSTVFSTVKIPGLRKSSDVTLKQITVKADTSLYDYFNEVRMNTIQRKQVTVQLLDEGHSPLFTWMLKQAFPIKISGTHLSAQNSEMVVEEIVLAHEGITMAKG